MPKVSVIIPCYNQGKYVDDAVQSVLAQTYTDFEIIIVNDGSTDPFTIDLLSSYVQSRTKVIVTSNQGLAAARNNGIRAASGQYILPLDADDRIEPTYMENAVAVLDSEPDTGIVYCRARLFGAVETDWDLPDYTLQMMLVDNIIFCSAFYRRDDWVLAGGYDEGMIYGWEDYEFWLGLIERGRRVKRIDKALFLYRVASDSMVRSKEKWQKIEMFQRIYLRHQKLFSDNISVWIEALLESRDRYFTSRLYVDCGEGISDGSSVARKVDQGTRQIVFDLSNFTGIRSVRFDPVDTWAVVTMGSVCLSYRSGRTRTLNTIESNALYIDNGRLLFADQDPQCFFSELDGSEVTDLVSLSVDLTFHAIGEHALEYLVSFQHKKLKKTKGRMLLEGSRIAQKLKFSNLLSGKRSE